MIFRSSLLLTFICPIFAQTGADYKKHFDITENSCLKLPLQRTKTIPLYLGQTINKGDITACSDGLMIETAINKCAEKCYKDPKCDLFQSTMIFNSETKPSNCSDQMKKMNEWSCQFFQTYGVPNTYTCPKTTASDQYQIIKTYANKKPTDVSDCDQPTVVDIKELKAKTACQDKYYFNGTPEQPHWTTPDQSKTINVNDVHADNRHRIEIMNKKEQLLCGCDKSDIRYCNIPNMWSTADTSGLSAKMEFRTPKQAYDEWRAEQKNKTAEAEALKHKKTKGKK